MSFRFVSTGSYVPENVVTNDDLAQFLDTSDEWITQRVGIKERHISQGESAADMAIRAAQNALDAAGLKGEDIDLIIAATLTADHRCPGVAATVQHAIGAHGIAFDVSAACSGFIFALETAAGYFERNTCTRALVIGAEQMSRILDWTDRSTCVIFGDGAGAAILEKGDNLIASKLFTRGGNEVIDIFDVTVETPFYHPEEKWMPHVFMNGQETFKFAVNTITTDIPALLEEAGLTDDDISYYILHQANVRILQFAVKRLKANPDKFPMNIDRIGNVSAASVPILLDELNRAGKLTRGKLFVLSAFGGGLTGATAVVRW